VELVDRECALVADAASAGGEARVAAERGIGDRQRAAHVVADAASAVGRVADECGIVDRQCAVVADAAAQASAEVGRAEAGDLTTAHRQAGDRDFRPNTYVEDSELGRPRCAAASHRQQRGTGAVDGEGAGQVGQGTRQGDRPDDFGGERDGVGSPVLVGLHDRGAERSGSGVAEPGHHDRGGDGPTLQGASISKTLVVRRRTRARPRGTTAEARRRG